MAELVGSGAPIDGFGIGTLVDVSADAPYLECAYKLEEYAARPRRKHSEGKATWPGCKQVYRTYDSQGRLQSDCVSLENDPQPGEPLLIPVMRSGRRVSPPDALTDLRSRTSHNVHRLPDRLKALAPAEPYEVQISPSLQTLAKTMDEQMAAAAKRG